MPFIDSVVHVTQTDPQLTFGFFTFLVFSKFTNYISRGIYLLVVRTSNGVY